MLDFLIVGQGIGGTLLAYELLQRNASFKVIDHFRPKSSSQIAAGMYNPIVYRTFQKTWMADDFLPKARKAYQDLSELLEISVDYPKSIWKVFGSEAEKALWDERRSSEDYQKYMGGIEQNLHPQVHMPFGAGEIRQAGYIDLPVLLQSFRQFLAQKGLLAEGLMDAKKLEITEEYAVYGNLKAREVIFSDGLRIEENPYFQYLPMKAVKGEILTLEIPDFDFSEILNKRVFFIPLGKNQYKVGATYDWNLNEIPSEKGADELLGYLSKYLKIKNFKVIHHQAGIRPTTRDRRPLLGKHPKFERLNLFNGLGTKGVLNGPFLAENFIQHLTEGTPIMKEARIERYEQFLGTTTP